MSDTIQCSSYFNEDGVIGITVGTGVSLGSVLGVGLGTGAGAGSIEGVGVLRAGVSAGCNGAVGVAQAPSKSAPIVRISNNFLILVFVFFQAFHISELKFNSYAKLCQYKKGTILQNFTVGIQSCCLIEWLILRWFLF